MRGSEGAESFPKRARIRRRREYLRVQRTAERFHGRHFVVLRTSVSGLHGRIGITVSSKVGNAVVRNRVKRLVREIVRRCWRTIEPPADIVVVAKPTAASVRFGEAQAELRGICGWSD